MAIWWPTGNFLNQSQHLCADSPPRLLSFVVESSREEDLSATPQKSLEHIDSTTTNSLLELDDSDILKSKE